MRRLKMQKALTTFVPLLALVLTAGCSFMRKAPTDPAEDLRTAIQETVPDEERRAELLALTDEWAELVDKLVLVVDSIQLKPECFIFLRKRVVPGMRDLVTDSWAVRRGVLPTPAARGGVEVST